MGFDDVSDIDISYSYLDSYKKKILVEYELE